MLQILSDGVGGLDANGIPIICGQQISNNSDECRFFDIEVKF